MAVCVRSFVEGHPGTQTNALVMRKIKRICLNRWSFDSLGGSLDTFDFSFSLEMASSPPIDLTTQLEYYVLRDTLLGKNFVEQDVKRALELASTYQHPDAQWLSKIFAGKDVKTRNEAKEVFLAQGDDDARALCFAALLAWPQDHARLRRSAEMGFAFAQAVVAGLTETTREQEFSFALRSSLQGERDGYFYLGQCFEDGWGCERDLSKAKENFHISAKLGHCLAMNFLGCLLDEADAQRWHWWGVAASRGYSWSFLGNFAPLIDRFKSDPLLAPAVFMIGRALKGHINTEKREIFGDRSKFDARIVPANRAVSFFSFQCYTARAAVDTWCLMARRINSKVNKDIRKKIGMLIWETRELALYKESNADEADSQPKRFRLS